jgi:hypothetical protein
LSYNLNQNNFQGDESVFEVDAKGGEVIYVNAVDEI